MSGLQVAATLAEKVLSPPKQDVKVLNFDQVKACHAICEPGTGVQLVVQSLLHSQLCS